MLHDDATPEALSVARIWVFGLWCYILVTSPLTSLATLPTSAFYPAGLLLRFLPPPLKLALLNPTSLLVLKWGGALTCALLMCNVRRGAVGVSACLILTVQQGVVRGFGHINHADIPLLFAAYILALYPLVDAVAARRRGANHAQITAFPGLPLILIAGFLCMTYMFVAMHRLVEGGWELFSSDTLTHWIVKSSRRPRFVSIDLDHVVLAYPVLERALRFVFPLSTIVELLAPFALVSRRFRSLFLPVIVGLHLMILCFMELLFWENLCLLLFLIDSRHWGAPRAVKDMHPIVFFDGVCGLCNHFVDWLLKRDRTGIYLLAPLQGETAREMLDSTHHEQLASIVLKDGDQMFTKSSASLRIISGVGGMWRLASAFLWVPKPLRDAVYTVIAGSRYKWFGKRDLCRMPQPHESERFME